MAIRYSILGLLHYRDMHGYRIKQHIEENFGHMWSINYGQIYPNLKKMCDEGLIAMKEVQYNGEKGPPRKLYAITEKGKKAFQKWIAATPEKKMLLRDPFLMRFVFFGFGDKQRSLSIIEEQIADYEKQLKRRRKNRDRLKKTNLYVDRMVDLGVGLNEMFLQWLKETREAVAGSSEEELRAAGAAMIGDDD